MSSVYPGVKLLIWIYDVPNAKYNSHLRTVICDDEFCVQYSQRIQLCSFAVSKVLLVFKMIPNIYNSVVKLWYSHIYICVQITGGAGFVGSHLVDALMADGHEVTVVDNFFTGRKENVAHWIGHSNFELINHDVVTPIFIEGVYCFSLFSTRFVLWEYRYPWVSVSKIALASHGYQTCMTGERSQQDLWPWCEFLLSERHYYWRFVLLFRLSRLI